MGVIIEYLIIMQIDSLINMEQSTFLLVSLYLGIIGDSFIKILKL